MKRVSLVVVALLELREGNIKTVAVYVRIRDPRKQRRRQTRFVSGYLNYPNYFDYSANGFFFDIIKYPSGSIVRNSFASLSVKSRIPKT